MIHDWMLPRFEYTGDIADITDSQIEEWRALNAECKQHNYAYGKTLRDKRTNLIQNAVDVWGEHDKIVKYLTKTHVPTPYIRTDFEALVSSVMKARENTLSVKRSAERDAIHTELNGKAIEYLISIGKAINVDFSTVDAVEIANDVAYHNKIAETNSEIAISGILVAFNGDENCEECGGWDGVSRRCECGNRRVGWSGCDNDDSFLEPYIYGEAW